MHFLTLLFQMDDSRYEEMRKYRNEAINIEKKLEEKLDDQLIPKDSIYEELSQPVLNVNLLSNLGEVINQQASLIDQCLNEISFQAQHIVNDLDTSTSTSDTNKKDDTFDEYQINNGFQTSSENHTPCPASLESLETVINANICDESTHLLEESLNQESKALALMDHFYEDRQKLIGYLNKNFSSYIPTVVEMNPQANSQEKENISKTERPQTLSLRSSTSEILKSHEIEYDKNLIHGSSSLSNIPSISNIPSTSSVTERSLLKSDTTKDSGYDARTYQIDEDLSTDTELDNEFQNDVFQQCTELIQTQNYIQVNTNHGKLTSEQTKFTCETPIFNPLIETEIDLDKKYDYLNETQKSQHLELESPQKTNTQDSYSLIDQSVTISEISSSPIDISESSDLKESTSFIEFQGQFRKIYNEYDKDVTITESESKKSLSHCSTSTVSLIEQKDASTWVPENDFKTNISHQSTSTPTKQFCNKLVQANIDNDFDISKTLQYPINGNDNPMDNVHLTISPSKSKQGKCKTVFEYIEKLLEFGKLSNRPYFETDTPPLEKCTSNASWKSCQSDLNENEINPHFNNRNDNVKYLMTYSNGTKESNSKNNRESIVSLYSSQEEFSEPERDQSTPKLIRQGSYILDAPSPLLSAHIQTCGIVGPNDNPCSKQLFSEINICETMNKDCTCSDNDNTNLNESYELKFDDDEFNAEEFVSNKLALLEEKKRMEASIIAEATRLKLSPEIVEKSQKRRQAEWAQRRAAAEALAEAKCRRESAAATRIVAVARGYLVRRLFKTEHVQSLIRTIKDTMSCAMSLHKIPMITREDVDLHKRLIMQVLLYVFF